ncbi:hypothetical protein NXY00_11935 [Bacteroides sp. BFG-551]|nr:hypothetical protein [Bacteroides sp. BFG-551]
MTEKPIPPIIAPINIKISLKLEMAVKCRNPRTANRYAIHNRNTPNAMSPMYTKINKAILKRTLIECLRMTSSDSMILDMRLF